MELKKTQQKRLSGEQKAVCFVIIMITFVSAVSGSSMNLLVPTIGKEFSISTSMIGLLMTGFSFTVAVLSVPFGRLADIIGKRRIFVPGVLIFTVSAIIPVFAPSFAFLLAFRILQATGSAMTLSTSTAIIAVAIPEEVRGKVVGIVIASMYVGLMTGPISAGIINHHFGWRTMFIVIFVLGAIAFTTAFKKLPNDGKSLQNLNFNIFKDVVYIFKLFAGNAVFTLLNIVLLIASGVGYAIIYIMSIYLQVAIGYPSQTAGFILIAQPFLMTVVSPYAGKLADRVSTFKLATIGMVICTVGVGIGVLINTSVVLLVVIGTLVISGVGFGLFAPSNTISIMLSAGEKDYGTASAVLTSMRYLGYTSSIGIVSIIASIFMGDVPIAEAQTDVLVMTLRTSLVIFTILCVIGVLISVNCMTKNRKRNGQSK